MQRTGLSQKLRDITALILDNEGPEHREDPIIRRTEIQQPIADDYHARARRLALIKDRDISTRYNNISNAVMLYDNITTWDDFQVGKRPMILLQHLEIDANSATTFGNVYDTLFESLSEYTVAYLLFMAFNTRNPAGDPIFAVREEGLCDLLNSKVPSEFSQDGFFMETAESPVVCTGGDPENPDIDNMFKSCCFVAASYLRLLSKEPANVANIGESIKATYLSFYKKPLALRNFHPKQATLEHIKDILMNKDIFKNTTYALLYSGECCTLGMDIKDFLYRKQISYAGLHCYSLFLRCARAYSVDNTRLANTIYSSLFGTEMDALCLLINECGAARTPAEKKLMWRYARIYDNRFFSILQTKNCPLFVGMLGLLLKKGAPSRMNEDVMRIVHVANLPEKSVELIEKYSTTAAEYLTYKRSDGHMAVMMEG
ncbi:49K [red clover associated varicosavirus]|jgi:hypothetical protein|uniref:Nucleoprotein n=1 Tax=red clover associated varicosavirus TaxID=2848052 RepID=A0A2R2Z7M6_9RHAB|nr:49K [Red clover varicosavirus]AUD57854.1 49K [red clover associated varicosavirus]